MQLALLADVHGNLEALDAVLADVGRRAPRATVVCAGDIVGYGPDPDACLQRLLERDAVLVRGNHEEMVLGWRDNTRCVAAGIVAARWTRRRLTRRHLRALASLPSVATVPGDRGRAHDVVVCHGDLDDAGAYVSDAPRAARALERLLAMSPRAHVLVCGHTHAAMLFSRTRGMLAHRDGEVLGGAALDGAAGAVLVNPGAVGQARDGVARARWALLDRERALVTFFSVAYDHATTVAKLKDARLVARVAFTPPRGLWRHVERGKAAAARAYVRVPVLLLDAVHGSPTTPKRSSP